MKERTIVEAVGYVEAMLGGTKARILQKLTDNWRLFAGEAPGASEAEFDDSSWRVVGVPHDYSVEGPFDASYLAGGYVRSGVVWYRGRFGLHPAGKAGAKHFLTFDGVSMNAQVWVNGRFLGAHPYAYTPFGFDVTPYVSPDGDNVVAVRADASLQPFGRSYSGVGLFRSVSVTSVSALHVVPYGVSVAVESADEGQADVTARTELAVGRYAETVWNAFAWQGEGMAGNNEIVKSCRLSTSIVDKDGHSVAEAEDTFDAPAFGKFRFEQKLNVRRPALWSPEEPHLYRVRTELYVEGELADDLWTPLGIRTLAFDAAKGFALNGRETKLKGVCLHKDAAIFGGAVPVKAWAKRLLLLKEAGVNAVRTSHHPFPEEFYHVCDYVGMTVMDEAFDEWRQGWDRGLSESPYGKNEYGYHLYFDQWHETDLRAMVRRDRNHPSVVMWSVGNEIPELYFDEGIPILRRLVAICKEEDPTRPVTVCAEGNHLLRVRDGIMDLVDVAGFNYITGREGDVYYDRIRAEHPDWVLLGSETEYETEHWKRISENPDLIGQFLWVGYDYLGEGADMLGEDAALGQTFDITVLSGNKGEGIIRRGWAFGLVDSAHEPSGEYFYRRSAWSEEPFVRLAVKQDVPAGREAYAYLRSEPHWNWTPGERKTVCVFTNLNRVELFLNGRKIGEGAADMTGYRALEFEVDFEPGKLRAVGYVDAGDGRVDELTTAGPAAGISLRSDCDSLKPDGRDHADVSITIVDADGVRVPHAENRVSVTVAGSGDLLGVYSADMTSKESYRSDNCVAYRGRALAVVRAGTGAGTIELEATAEGLPAARLTIDCM